MRQQCELLGVNHSSLYYKVAGEKEENLHLMELLDEQYTQTPYYGSRKMTAWLRSQGYQVNRKRVRRLLQTMGLETIYQKPDTSRANNVIPAKAGTGEQSVPLFIEKHGDYSL